MINPRKDYPGHRGIAVRTIRDNHHEIIDCGVIIARIADLDLALWLAKHERHRIKPLFPIVRVRPRNRAFELRGAH